MSDLPPPDYTRCQAMITPAYSAFQLGPREKPGRCTNAPAWLGTEVIPGDDGRCGQMTMCEGCAKVFRDTSPIAERVEMTPIDRVTLSDRIRPTVEAAPWVHEAIQELEVTLEAAQYGVNLWQDQAAYWKALYEESRADDQRAMSYLEEIRAAVGKDLDWPGVVRAVQALAAHVSECREVLNWIFFHVPLGADAFAKLKPVVKAEAPATSLARLKAEWQAEALEAEAVNFARGVSDAGSCTERLIYKRVVRSLREASGKLRRQAEGGDHAQ